MTPFLILFFSTPLTEDDTPCLSCFLFLIFPFPFPCPFCIGIHASAVLFPLVCHGLSRNFTRAQHVPCSTPSRGSFRVVFLWLFVYLDGGFFFHRSLFVDLADI